MFYNLLWLACLYVQLVSCLPPCVVCPIVLLDRPVSLLLSSFPLPALQTSFFILVRPHCLDAVSGKSDWHASGKPNPASLSRDNYPVSDLSGYYSNCYLAHTCSIFGTGTTRAPWEDFSVSDCVLCNCRAAWTQLGGVRVKQCWHCGQWTWIFVFALQVYRVRAVFLDKGEQANDAAWSCPAVLSWKLGTRHIFVSKSCRNL